MLDTAPRRTPRRVTPKTALLMWLATAGPGLAVMLADTDAGSLITAAQSGATWGYSLLLAQLVLIPIVFVVQELTVRLGLVTGKGHGELIRERFGTGWAWLSVSTLVLACAGAIVTEMSGIAGVGMMWGLPKWVGTLAVVAFLAIMVVTGSYRRVERVAIAVGLFELVFLVTMFLAGPDPHQIVRGLATFPIGNSDYMFLIAANIGAVVMPWMIFYQQSAVVDKGLTVKHLRIARWDTAVGSVITQLVMVGMLVTVAATLWAHGQQNASLNTVQDISDAITPHLGDFAGRVLFSLGMVGASLIAAIVASLTAAWGLGEVTGYKRSLEHSPREAPWFYAVFFVVILAGAMIVLSGVNLIQLNLWVQVMNALLLPTVLTFLYLLARKALSGRFRLAGAYRWIVLAIIAATAGLGVYSAVMGILGT
ncbi:divalent metal cation transporter [Corynebacteriales bacterium D3-21]|uniref:Divalent metal cation transporter n=2 Tax=Speluncibacter jeojiensis TaxID=2710754 RepID=A0A9X4M4A5_9ACTN|nr:divalent metal cation transporter [Rhodococcus sp. D2-41]MDG3014161.1 divalent metal cation transporter [Corynebacteriales bacterium D3-21]